MFLFCTDMDCSVISTLPAVSQITTENNKKISSFPGHKCGLCLKDCRVGKQQSTSKQMRSFQPILQEDFELLESRGRLNKQGLAKVCRACSTQRANKVVNILSAQHKVLNLMNWITAESWIKVWQLLSKATNLKLVFSHNFWYFFEAIYFTNSRKIKILFWLKT